MLSAGNFASSAMQSPRTIWADGLGMKLTRGARTDAPRRDTTMTQNSDSGDAAGDAGPTTDSDALWAPKVKIGLIGKAGGTGKELPSNYIGEGVLIGAVVAWGSGRSDRLNAM